MVAMLDELLAASRTLGPNARTRRAPAAGAGPDRSRPLAPRRVRHWLDAEALFVPLRAGKRLCGAPPAVGAGALGVWPPATSCAHKSAIDEAGPVVAAAGQGDDPAWHKIHQLQARVHLANGRAADALKAADDALDWSQRLAVDPDGSLHVADDRLLRAQAQRMLGNVEARTH